MNKIKYRLLHVHFLFTELLYRIKPNESVYSFEICYANTVHAGEREGIRDDQYNRRATRNCQKFYLSSCFICSIVDYQ